MSLWDVMVSIFWFSILVAWISLLFSIIGDLFRDDSLSGWGKAAWAMFLIVVPWIGVLCYLGARGSAMEERRRAHALRNEQAYRKYAQEAAPVAPASTADELGKLADLRDRGAISAEDYNLAKSALLGPAASPAVVAQRGNSQVVLTN